MRSALALSLLLICIIAGCSKPEVVDISTPPIVRRATWGAMPAVVDTANCYTRALRTELHTIAIHHTAICTDSPLVIQRYHMVERGFADIGYHFFIASDGTIYEGRLIGERGAHVAGQNNGVIGIALSGNFEETEPTSYQADALKSLVAYLVASYDIGKLGGHREFGRAQTLCPGRYALPLLMELRESLELESVAE